MPIPSTAFVYPIEEDEAPKGGQTAPRERAADNLVTLWRLVTGFELVFCVNHGSPPPPATILRRWTVLRLMLGKEQRSLSVCAKQLGCTPALLSKLGKEFGLAMDMQASWQRIGSRAIYADRARGVHAGTWSPTEKWERRKLREGANAKAKQTPDSATAAAR